MDDAFRILDLPDTATCDQVRKAYCKKAEIHHPDKGGSASSFAILHAAYRYAMQACKYPVPCTKCGGVGYTERASGWRVAQIICANCGGAGTTTRGGEL